MLFHFNCRTLLDLQLIEHQDLQLKHHQWFYLSNMLLPVVAQTSFGRHRPQITHTLHDNSLVENVALLPSRPRRSELCRILALLQQIDLAGPDYVIQYLHPRIIRLIVPGPC